MEPIKTNFRDAIEACFETDPSPHIEKIWCNIWCNTKPKKGAGATLVQQQKRIKTMQNDTKSN